MCSTKIGDSETAIPLLSWKHYGNTPMQYTAIFHGCKNDNFQLKFLIIVIILLKTKIVGTR